MSTTDASNIYRETADASGFVMDDNAGLLGARKAAEEATQSLAGVTFSGGQTVVSLEEIPTFRAALIQQRDEAIAARKADWEILKGSPQEAMARLETVVHAAQVALKAIHTGRSEPLFIARDCLRNALEDIGASTDTE